MTQLPPVKMIKDVLDGMLDREVQTVPGAPLGSVDMIGGVVAGYVDDSGVLRAVVGWNLPAAALVGAAVGLIPSGAAEDAVEAQYLPGILLENLSEVSNVLASAFHSPGNPHLRLHETYRPVAAAPPAVTALLYSLGQRLDLDVDIPRYGKGRLAVVMTM